MKRIKYVEERLDKHRKYVEQEIEIELEGPEKQVKRVLQEKIGIDLDI